MEKCIPVDRLARPDNWVVLRGRQVREIREEQGSNGRPMPFDEETLRSRLHGIMTGELQAMEAAGRTLFDFPDAPWEFQLDMARQVWDESRHSEIFQRLLEYMGGRAGRLRRDRDSVAMHAGRGSGGARRGDQSRTRGARVRRLRSADSDRAAQRRRGDRARGRLRARRRDHARADGLEVDAQADRGRPRAAGDARRRSRTWSMRCSTSAADGARRRYRDRRRA